MAITTPFYLNNSLANPIGGSNVRWDEQFGKGSPKFTLETDRGSATRVVHVHWADWPLFARSVMGFTAVGASTSTGKPCLNRGFPWAIPIDNSSGKRFLFASKMEIEGVGSPTPLGTQCYEGGSNNAIAVYNLARCTINFDTRTYDILSDQDMESRTVDYSGGSPSDPALPDRGNDESCLLRYITKIVKPAGEFLTLDGRAYYYSKLTNTTGAVTHGIPLARGINKTIVSFNVSLTWHLVPKEAIPSAFYNPGASNLAIDKCLGRVNRATFDGAKQGTMLLMAVELKPMVSPIGDRVFDVTYMFKYFNPTTTADAQGNTPGHNHIFRPVLSTNAVNPAGWYEVLSGETVAITAPYTNFPLNKRRDGVNIYDWADFNNLFRPATYTPPA